MTTPIEASTVEALLRERAARASDGAEHPELEVVALYVEGTADDAQRARAEVILAADPDLREAVATLRDIDGEQKVVSLAARRAARRPPPARWVVAIAAAILGVVGVSLWATGDKGPLTDGAIIGASIGAGAGERVSVTVVTEDGPAALSRHGQPKDGAELRLAYTAKMAGHLAVVRLDGDGGITPLFGATGVQPITTGAAVTLPDPVRFEAGRGCQWIVAAFASEAFDLAKLTTGLQAAARDPEACTLGPLSDRLPFARSVQHTLIRR